MTRLHTFAALFFALTLSVWLGREELRTDDTGILVGLIATGGFIAAMVEPRQPWIWGLILPAGIILVNAWRLTRGDAGTFCSIAGFTVGVGSAASYIGAFIRGHASPYWQ